MSGSVCATISLAIWKKMYINENVHMILNRELSSVPVKTERILWQRLITAKSESQAYRKDLIA